jgi:hypothetical protein
MAGQVECAGDSASSGQRRFKRSGDTQGSSRHQSCIDQQSKYREVTDSVLAQSDPKGDHQGAMFMASHPEYSMMLETASFYKCLLDIFNECGQYITRKQFRN